MNYLSKGIKPLFVVVYLMKLDAHSISIARKWKEFKLWKYKHKTKGITKDKCILLGIKDDNVPPKFIVPVENTTLKYHNSYKSGLENIEL
jgi:hypothetical protein